MDLPTTRHDQSENRDTRGSEGKTVSVARVSKMEKLSSYIFLICVFLAPLIFIPSLYAPLDLVKTVFLSVFVLIAAIVYVVSILKNRAIAVPRYAIGWVSIAIIISTCISAILSSNFSKSFLGQGFEVGTASFIFLMFLTAFLVSRMVIKNKEIVFKIYSAIIISFLILAILHVIRLFGGAGILSFGILNDITSSILGKWYDLAAMAAVTGIVSFLGIKFLTIGKGLKNLLIVSLIVSGFVLFVINFTLVWYVLALIVLCIGIYEYRSKSPKSAGIKGIFSRISLFTFIILIIVAACAWKGTAMVTPLLNHYKIQYGEAVLPWQLTLDVTADTLKETPLFGAGPNRFGFQYLRFKPLAVNQTPFWNSEFSSGFGTIPTFVVTLGLVGLILWCLFFIYFVRDGIRSLKRATDPLKSFFATSSFFAAAFLWAINLVYIPSHIIIFLTFVFTGVCIGITLSDARNAEKDVIVGGPKYTRFAPVLSTIVLVALLVWLGIYLKKAIAVAYFQSGIKQLNIGGTADIAQADFKKALLWDKSDIYYQALSEVNILKINALVAQLQASSTPNSTPDQSKIDQVVALTNEAVKYTKSAEGLDPLNYYNYIAEARISEIAASLKVPNAYENARAAYVNALKTNPYNPGIYLNLAQLDAAQAKYTNAEQDIGSALQLKPNYTEAVYLLSQIQVANNQLKDAIISANAATQLLPTEPTLFFQLGLLQYNDKDYENAAKALEKAVALNPQYANAQYFLGLSYARLGRNEDAIKQFETLAKTNPDNQEIAFILTNLKAGKSPFADVKPPIDSKPEKRKTLPVADKTTTTSKTSTDKTQ